MITDADEAYKHAAGHRAEVRASRTCGCFYCLATFPPNDIAEWIGDTALCPKCGIDAVIGSRSGCPVDDRKFLRRMHCKWFAVKKP